jgi:hypothetical protein
VRPTRTPLTGLDPEMENERAGVTLSGLAPLKWCVGNEGAIANVRCGVWIRRVDRCD